MEETLGIKMKKKKKDPLRHKSSLVKQAARSGDGRFLKRKFGDDRGIAEKITSLNPIFGKTVGGATFIPPKKLVEAGGDLNTYLKNKPKKSKKKNNSFTKKKGKRKN